MKNAKRKNEKKMNERLRNIKGITLISLVITVIILLILAAVAINLAVDSNGLFKKTGDAANSWNTSVADEQDAMGGLIDTLESVLPTEITLSTDLPEGWNSSTVSKVAIAGDKKAPIPVGFVASSVAGENSISGGLVIYETTTEVTEANHDTALTEYNQYVWIPVDDINDMIMCSVCGGASRKLVYDEETKTLTCTNTHEENAEPKLVGKLYTSTDSYTTDADNNRIYTYTMDFAKNDQTYDANSGFREPANLVYSYGGDASSTGITEIKKILNDTTSTTYDEIKDAWLELQQTGFNNMAQSVAKYKGFYISRYEVGANGASKKGQTVLNAGEDSANMWYGLYSTIRKTGSSTTSQMIWRKPV